MPRGYQMQLGKNGEPQFKASPTSICSDNWDDRFFSSGADDAIYAVADDGNGNIYVGGDFANIGGVKASNIAKWNGSHWSALGDESDVRNNGVGQVYTLAIKGTGVYVGGSFRTAVTSATNFVYASNIAFWDGTSWSALGDPSDDNNNGTDGDVYALADDKHQEPVGVCDDDVPERIFR